ncbi:MAG: hypothetical protein IT200_16610 [Thermoleophilia bacterium]|nr:hypothetical protein [Thermoleophilia bacterium]
MATDLEDRLTRMGDAVAPDDAATARARAAVRDALPASPRPRRWGRLMPRRRVLSAAFAVAGTVAIAAVLVLALPRGEDRSAPAGITLVATGPAPGVTIDPSELKTAADMIDRRAEIMGIDGADAEVVGDGIVLHLPADAPPGTLRELTARGDLAVYDSADIVGDPNGVPAPVQPGSGQRVIDIQDPLAGTANHVLIEDRPALTNADVVAVEPSVVLGDQPPSIEVRLTPEGRRALHVLTRGVARRGANEGTVRAVMLVVDGVLVSNPTVDPQQFPDGLNSPSFIIGGNFSATDASWRRVMAAQIEEGPLPVVLTPVG